MLSDIVINFSLKNDKFSVCVGFAKHCRAADVWWSITVKK